MRVFSLRWLTPARFSAPPNNRTNRLRELLRSLDATAEFVTRPHYEIHTVLLKVRCQVAKGANRVRGKPWVPRGAAPAQQSFHVRLVRQCELSDVIRHEPERPTEMKFKPPVLADEVCSGEVTTRARVDWPANESPTVCDQHRLQDPATFL